MGNRSDFIIIIVFIALVVWKPDFLTEFISRKEVMMGVNIVIGGYLIWNLITLFRARATTERFWLKVFFNVGILVVPALFLIGRLELDTQALLLYLIVLGFFYMTIMK